MQIWKYSSDNQMRHHQPGDGHASSSNICLQYIAAKSMTYTTLLHLYVHDFKSEPPRIIESLRNHLQAVKLDGDVNMIVYLVTSIISTLLASCGIMDKLNQQGYVAEQEDKCKVHLNSSKSCVDVIRLISMWLNLIFGRAIFIMGLIANISPSDTKLGQLAEAIERLGTSSFFLFLMESLTRALNVIVETTSRNTFSKVLSSDGCLDETFRSCLGAIRNSIALVHACGNRAAPVIQSMHSKAEWESAANIYISCVVSSCSVY